MPKSLFLMLLLLFLLLLLPPYLLLLPLLLQCSILLAGQDLSFLTLAITYATIGHHFWNEMQHHNMLLFF